MGNQLAGIAPLQIYPVDYYLSQIKELQYESSMGSTRFMKVARARTSEGTVVVKVFVLQDPAMCVREEQKHCQQLRQVLAPLPHCLPYSRATVIADKFAILIREHIRYGLYDRLSTRPFLSDHEKRWLTYQLLVSLSACHARHVCHGDLKLENLLVTSALWLSVADWASYKPALLADDNPADFGYFFDASRRRLCYIAPERFVSAGELEAAASGETPLGPNHHHQKEEELESSETVTTPTTRLSPAMDMFSAGCCLTELWSDGACVPFDLPQLLAYRQQQEYPDRLSAALKQHVADEGVREMLAELMALEPGKRPSAEQCLRRFTAPEPPLRWQGEEKQQQQQQRNDLQQKQQQQHQQELDSQQQLQDPQQQKQQQHQDQHKEPQEPEQYHDTEQQDVDVVEDTERERYVFPASFQSALHPYMVELHMHSGEWTPDSLLNRLWIDFGQKNSPQLRLIAPLGEESSAAVGNISLILGLVVSCSRRLVHSISKLRCIALVATLCEHLPLYITVDRALPYLLRHADDARDARVRCAALSAVCRLLQLKRKKSSCEENTADLSALMPEYVWPMLWPLAQDRCVIVRRCFARHLAVLADIALKLLLSAHKHCTRASLASEVGALRHAVQQRVQVVMADSDAAVRRALLVHGFVPLCAFFGRHCAADLLLSHMATLVDAGGVLRAAFYGTVDDVVKRVGANCLEPLSPLLLQGMSDWDELVAGASVNALVRLARAQQTVPSGSGSGAGLLSPALAESALHEALPLLVHPSLQLRHAAVGLISTCACNFSLADVHCRLMPALMPALKSDAGAWLADAGDQPSLMSALRTHVPRAVFDSMLMVRCSELLAPAFAALKVRLGAESSGGASSTSPSPATPSYSSSSSSDLATLLSRLPSEALATEHEQRSVLVLSPLLFKLHQRRQQVGGDTGATRAGLVGVAHCRLLKHHLDATTPASTPEQYRKPTNAPNSNQISQFRPHCCHLLSQTLTSLQHQFRTSAMGPAGSGGGGAGGVFQQLPGGWRPRGQLVAHLHEHEAAVVRLAALPDSALFASASRDCSIRLWDAERMEGRNIANRSVSVFECDRLANCTGANSPLTCLAYSPWHTALASANENGDVFTINVQQQHQKNKEKASPLHVRHVDVARDGCVMDMAHMAPNMVVFATGCGKVVGWDLRCSPDHSSSGWLLSQGPQHGLVTALCTDMAVRPNWLVVGTSNGLHTCWDLRFQLPVTRLLHPHKVRVRRLVAHPFQPSWFISAVSGNCEVDMWNIETGERQIVLWPSTRPPLSSCQRVRHSVCALHVPPYGAWPCHQSSLEGPSQTPIPTSSDTGWLKPSPLLLTGGTDMFCRVWDLQQPIRSRLLTWPGIQLSTTASAAGGANSSAEAAGSPFVEATVSPAALAEQVVATYRTQVVDGIEVVHECLQRRSATTSPSNDPCRRGPDPVPPGHVDTISDLITTRASQWLVVSASQDGVVKVWK